MARKAKDRNERIGAHSSEKRPGELSFLDFDGILARLQIEHPELTSNFTSGYLRDLAEKLLAFHDDTFHSDKKHFMPFPASVFRSEDPRGPLYTILERTVVVYHEQGWGNFDFGRARMSDKNLSLFQDIRMVLQRKKFLPHVVVYFQPEVSEIDKLRSIVVKRGGTVTTNPNAATHIVVPTPPSEVPSEEKDGETDESAFVRALNHVSSDGKYRRVHWWYTPDSHDEWLPIDEVDGPEEEVRPSPPFTVFSRFIEDLGKFNEWMNEIDYDPSFCDAEGKPETPQRKRSREQADVGTAASPTRKKAKLDEPPVVDDEEVAAMVVDTGSEPVAMKEEPDSIPRVRLLVGSEVQRSRGNSPTSTTTAAGPGPAAASEKTMIRLRMGDAPGASAQGSHIQKEKRRKGSSSRAAGQHGAQVDFMSLPKLERHTQTDANVMPEAPGKPINVPSYSVWFSLKSVNDIEKRALPEFFTGKNPSKTEDVYVMYRNTMVDAFRLNPKIALSFTSVRRRLAGEVGGMLRVFRFLEQWGLINFGPAGEDLKKYGPPQATASWPMSGAPSGTAALARAHPALSDVLRGHNSTGAPLGAPLGAADAPNLSLRRSIYPTAASTKTKAVSAPASTSHDPSFHCNTCSGDCSRARYHYRREADYDLCEQCFVGKRFPSSMKPSDFMFLRSDTMSSAGEEADDWTLQETLLLLEALELYNESWGDVAEHVASKSAEQCILHFLRLPIQDPYLSHSLQIQTQPSPAAPTVLSEMPSPILSMAAYIGSVVPPAVAMAAVKGAREALVEIGEKSEGKADDESVRDSVIVTAGAALAAASVKSKVLANEEEKKIRESMTKLVELTVAKLDLRMKQIEDLAELMRFEREQLECERHQLFADRLWVQRAKILATDSNGKKVPIPAWGYSPGTEEGKEKPLKHPEHVAVATYVPPSLKTTDLEPGPLPGPTGARVVRANAKMMMAPTPPAQAKPSADVPSVPQGWRPGMVTSLHPSMRMPNATSPQPQK